MDLPNDAVPLVSEVIRDQLEEQVIAGLDSNCVYRGHFCELHLGGGNFKFPCHLVLCSFLLWNLEELLHIFEELLAFRGDSFRPISECTLEPTSSTSPCYLRCSSSHR